jgi:hypothetical protein
MLLSEPHLMVFARVVTIALILPHSSAADADWTAVQNLRPEQRVKVYLTDGRVLKGTIHSADVNGLAVRAGGQDALRVARTSVTRVTKKSRGSAALWGGVIGFGIGLPVGAAAGPYLADFGNPPAATRMRHGLGWGAFFGGVGAGIGALAGSEQTLYKVAPANSRTTGGSATAGTAR